jgi:hypothetical protein
VSSIIGTPTTHKIRRLQILRTEKSKDAKKSRRNSERIQLCSNWVSDSGSYVMKSSVFWDITPHSPLKVKQRFRETCRLHISWRRINQTRKQHDTGSKQNALRSLLPYLEFEIKNCLTDSKTVKAYAKYALKTECVQNALGSYFPDTLMYAKWGVSRDNQRVRGRSVAQPPIGSLLSHLA